MHCSLSLSLSLPLSIRAREKLAIQPGGFEGATDWQPINDRILIDVEERERKERGGRNEAWHRSMGESGGEGERTKEEVCEMEEC